MTASARRWAAGCGCGCSLLLLVLGLLGWGGDGLPEDLETALEPFRDRLAATWSASTNRIELPLAEHETPWEWR